MKQENNPSIGEAGFILMLERKSRDQKKMVETQIIPNWARGIGVWLAVNPWRVLVPLATILYLFFRFIWGVSYREFILGLFGGFVR